MNDDQILLASAYLDGDVTADERAAAQADPIVMAEVERLRTLRSELATVDPPAAATRESAVAAALGVFTETIRVPAPAPQRVAWHRPVYRRALAMAAAVVAIGVLGVVIVNTGGDDGFDSDDATVSQDAGDDATDTGAFVESAPRDGERAEMAEESDDFGADAGDDSADETELAEMAPATLAPAAEAAEPATADDADDAAAEGDTEEAGGADRVDAVFARLEEFLSGRTGPLLDEVDVAAYGLYLVELEGLGELPPTPNTICVFPDADAGVTILGQTLYRSADGERAVLIAVQAETGQAFALDADSCDVMIAGMPVDGVVP